MANDKNSKRSHLFSTTALAAITLGMMMASSAALAAAPQGGKVAAGSATITTVNQGNGNTSTTINQTTSKAVITWTGFNTTTSNSVQFNAPNANAITLNEISGPISSINGLVTGNDQLWFINPNGFLLGSGAHINAAGLLFSTSGIANATTNGFYTNPSSYYQFGTPGGPSGTGIVAANGALVYTAAPGSYVVLQGQAVNVKNSLISTPSAPSGSPQNQIAFGVGGSFSADFDGDGLISYSVSSPVTQKVVGPASSLVLENSNIQANGGSVTFQAVLNKDAVLDHVINLGGDYYDSNGNVMNPAVGDNTVNANQKSLYEWSM